MFRGKQTSKAGAEEEPRKAVEHCKTTGLGTRNALTTRWHRFKLTPGPYPHRRAAPRRILAYQSRRSDVITQFGWIDRASKPLESAGAG
jgi:hypothetical protein